MTFVALNRFSGENGKTSQGRRESMRERGKSDAGIGEKERESERKRDKERERDRSTFQRVLEDQMILWRHRFFENKAQI